MELSQLLTIPEATEFFIGSEQSAIVVHVKDPCDFFIRPPRFDVLLDYIANKIPKNRPYSLKKFDIISFKINKEGDGKYARGKILDSVTEENVTKYNILAIDHGLEFNAVPEEDIWECDEEFRRITALAPSCVLEHCVPLGESWSNYAIAIFKRFVSNKTFRMVILDKVMDRLIVKLELGSSLDVAKMMARSKLSSLARGSCAYSRLIRIPPPETSCTFKKLKENDTFVARVQCGESLKSFYVCDLYDYKQYVLQSANLHANGELGRQLSPAEMKPGKFVFAWCTGGILERYDRAIIKEIVDGESASVQFVDWGTIEVVHISKIKTISDYCSNLPATAIFCSTEDQAWDNGLDKFLTRGYSMIITIKKVGNGFESPNIVSIAQRPSNSEPI